MAIDTLNLKTRRLPVALRRFWCARENLLDIQPDIIMLFPSYKKSLPWADWQRKACEQINLLLQDKNYSVVFFSNSLDAAMRKGSVSFSIPVFPSIIIIIIVIIINIKVLATERRDRRRGTARKDLFLLIKRIPFSTVCFSLSLSWWY